MSRDMIRVGIIGAGDNTRNKHIPGLQATENVKIVTVCNRTKESSQRVADQFDIPNIDEHWTDVINANDLDAIVIGTWPYMHHPITVQALRAGKHVMCEARMAMNLDEARAMRQTSRLNPSLVAQIVPSPMTLGVDNTVRRMIAEGYLGNLLAIDVRSGGRFVDLDGAMHWRHDIDLSGYNIMNMGIWYEALMRWVGEATGLMAMGRTIVTMRQNEGRLKAVHVPDHLNIIAEMACGVQANFTISSVSGLAEGIGAYLYGSQGTLKITGSKLCGGQRGSDTLTEINIPDDESGGWRVEEEFVNAIQGKETIKLTDFETGYKYMAFTEAVNISLRERRFVVVPV